MPDSKRPMSKKLEKQTRYLSQAIQLEESVNPHIIRATMAMVSCAILAFLVWAGFTNINEVARTPGEVVPQGYQLTVQHLEGGLVQTIHVHDGDFVKQDDSLITISDASIKEDLERAKSKQLSLGLQAERLRAFAEGREPNFSSFEGAGLRMIEDQEIFFSGMRDARAKEAEIIRDQIAQKEQAIHSYAGDISTARKSLNIAQDMHSRRKELHAKGYVSDMQILEEKNRINEIQGNINRLNNQILVARQEIKEFEGRLLSLSASQKDEVNEKLDYILSEEAQNQEVIDKLNERIGRLEVRAPADGMIKGLAINTQGAVIQPGQKLMEIVPMEKGLEVQVKISPKDIGHIRIGQPVQVKFSSYDFSRYGSVRGELDQISATTFTSEDGGRFYQGRVTLNQDHVGFNPNNKILPGMTVMADVVTGEKTILQYLLKPIHVSIKTAFSER